MHPVVFSLSSALMSALPYALLTAFAMGCIVGPSSRPCGAFDHPPRPLACATTPSRPQSRTITPSTSLTSAPLSLSSSRNLTQQGVVTTRRPSNPRTSQLWHQTPPYTSASFKATASAIHTRSFRRIFPDLPGTSATWPADAEAAVPCRLSIQDSSLCRPSRSPPPSRPPGRQTPTQHAWRLRLASSPARRRYGPGHW